MTQNIVLLRQLTPGKIGMADVILATDSKETDEWSGRIGFMYGWNAYDDAVLIMSAKARPVTLALPAAKYHLAGLPHERGYRQIEVYDALKAQGINVIFSDSSQLKEAHPYEITDEMALAFHYATTGGAIGKDDVEEIKIGLQAALANLLPLVIPTQEGE